MLQEIAVGVWQEMTFAQALHQLGALGFDQSVAYSIIALTNKVSIRQPVSIRANLLGDISVSDVDMEVAGKKYSFRASVNERGEEETAYVVRRPA